jgi:hypothetical protein
MANVRDTDNNLVSAASLIVALLVSIAVTSRYNVEIEWFSPTRSVRADEKPLQSTGGKRFSVLVRGARACCTGRDRRFYLSERSVFEWKPADRHRSKEWRHRHHQAGIACGRRFCAESAQRKQFPTRNSISLRRSVCFDIMRTVGAGQVHGGRRRRAGIARRRQPFESLCYSVDVPMVGAERAGGMSFMQRNCSHSSSRTA